MAERRAHRNYFLKAVFSLLAAIIVLLYGCKQLSHTEKDNRNQEQNKVDSVAMVPERIVDTITLVTDTLAVADTVFGMDSLVETQFIASHKK